LHNRYTEYKPFDCFIIGGKTGIRMDKWNYAIGLDIGIASVGWSVVALDSQGDPYGIIKLGSRIFDKAEQPKTGESLAAPRRQARGLRRVIGRRALRKEDIYKLLAKHNIVTKEQMMEIFRTGHLEDIYELRTKALDELVTRTDFARILIHLAQRRGFKSNRKSESSDEGKLKDAVRRNQILMEEKGYRTVGEMFAKDELYSRHKRNKGSEYTSTVLRDNVIGEAVLIFESQRSLGNSWASEELQESYIEILSRQRSFDEGPGEPSPFHGNQISRMVGKCTLEPEETRAAKATASFEKFTLLQKINHIRVSNEDGEMVPLNVEQRQKVIDLAYKTPDVTFLKIRKALELHEYDRFNLARYRTTDSVEKAEKDEKLKCLNAYHEMRKALDGIEKGHIQKFSDEQLNKAAEILTRYKNDSTVINLLQEEGFSPEEADALSVLSFSKFGHISVKACRKLIPFLEQGLTYDKACKEAGYDFRGHNSAKSMYLPANTEQGAPELQDITNPVVRRAVSQAIKVINAIIREQGCSPAFINIELARELSKDFAERNQITKDLEKNTAENERLKEELLELVHGKTIGGQDLVKYRLWKEQDGRSAYNGKPIEIERLLEPGYAEVDHIIPYSISFDDRRSNKVLVFAYENREKGNRLPLQYLEGKAREDFIVRTETTVKQYRKKQNLLKEKNTEETAEFRQRNLTDTQYLAVLLYNFITDHLEFAEGTEFGKRRVFTVNGAITSFLRKRWGLTKVREDGDLHHALDATVIACTTNRMIQLISGYYARIEGTPYLSKKGKELFPQPWDHFRDDLVLRLSDTITPESLYLVNPVFYHSFGAENIKPVMVSRMPRHKVTGQAHKETLKGTKALKDGYLTTKKSLRDLKLNKDGEIADYYNPESDLLLYHALKEQLQKHSGDGKKAFPEGSHFYKPKSDGTPGPEVRKVKLIEKSTLNVSLNDGTAFADNGSMVRIDVFRVPEEGYYFVPVYVADTKKKQLPSKAVIAGKPYSKWKEMDDKDFIFSIYPNDLLFFEHNKGINWSVKHKNSTLPNQKEATELFGYYIKAGIATATISIINHDNSYMLSSLGIKTLKSLKKFQIDILGNISEVKHERRTGFNQRSGG